MHKFFKLSVVCFFTLVLFAGCGSGPDVANLVSKKNGSNIQKVSSALRLYQIRLGKPAPSEDELCDFIANNTSIENNLELMKIDRDTFKDNLRCERDSEPFFVRYGVVVKERGPIHPLVFESVGVDGVRKVGWSNSTVTEVTDDKQYADLKRGKFKREKMVDLAAQASKEAAEANKK